MEIRSLCSIICRINHESIQKHCSGASKHCLQRNPEITSDTKLSGSLSRLTNVLESGDNRGLRPNTAWTNTMYESQWCDDVAEVENVRHNHLERH